MNWFHLQQLCQNVFHACATSASCACEFSQKCNANGSYDVRLDDGEEYKGVFAIVIAIAIIAACVTIAMTDARYACI